MHDQLDTATQIFHGRTTSPVQVLESHKPQVIICLGIPFLNLILMHLSNSFSYPNSSYPLHPNHLWKIPLLSSCNNQWIAKNKRCNFSNK
ncbi:hypothetical protein GIB67_023216 [Kingdonia uniflora]|uniref:Uncharacterized protein n=1 Tax=Kingdonia uniflora TaxID=39325 RepID=A0A7J7L989_9MAGN|nr:hypothetical protein GIB67_023216 [Kingdonia uniflora]